MGIGFDLDDRTRFTATDIQQQAGGAVHHLGLQLWIHPALEAVG